MFRIAFLAIALAACGGDSDDRESAEPTTAEAPAAETAMLEVEPSSAETPAAASASAEAEPSPAAAPPAASEATEDAQAHAERAAELLEERQWEEAIAEFDQAIALGSDLPDSELAAFHAGRARGYIGIADYQQALADADRAIELDADLALAYVRRAAAHNGLDRFREALADSDRAIELDPESAVAFIVRARAHANLGDHELAFADANRAVELDPLSARVVALRAATYLDLGNYDRALVDASRAIDLDPLYAFAYSVRGGAHAALGKFDRALFDYNRAIELDPESALAYGTRSVAHRDLGDPERALADASRAIELDPGLAGAYVSRGNAHYDLGNLEQALADYERALELNPDDPTAQRNRDLVLGDLAAAEVPSAALPGLESYRFTLSLAFDLEVDDPTVSGALTFVIASEGEWVAPDRFHARCEGTAFGLALQEEVISIGTESWIMSQIAGRFVAGEPAYCGPDLSPGAFAADLLESLETLPFRGEPETVNGVEALRYRIDEDTIAQILQLQELFGGSEELFGDIPFEILPEDFTSLGFDLWVARNGGWLVKLAMELGLEVEGQEVRLAIGLDVTDANGPDVRLGVPDSVLQELLSSEGRE